MEGAAAAGVEVEGEDSDELLHYGLRFFCVVRLRLVYWSFADGVCC